jgi:hypothetical protein
MQGTGNEKRSSLIDLFSPSTAYAADIPKQSVADQVREFYSKPENLAESQIATPVDIPQIVTPQSEESKKAF